MLDFLSHLFDTSGFPPRWQCGQWSEAHGWLHILSDLGVWSAYLAIPLVLGFFLVRRRDIPFRGILLLFGAFILACGTTHLMEAIIFWHPLYRLAGVIKLATALVSWVTVFALVPIVPRALAMRSPEELEREIAARKQAEEELLRVNADLEARVNERTVELTRAADALRDERELLRITLASIGDAVIATDAEGRVTFVNPVAEALTGWVVAEARGVPLGEVFSIVHEGSREPVENPALRALQDGAIRGLANHTLLIARDGTERPIDDSAAPIRDGGGVIAGAVLVFRDITERKREEDARAERSRLIALRADISTALASAEPTLTVLGHACEALVRHLDMAFARVWTLDDDNTVLELQASAGLYTHLNGDHSRIPVGQFKIGRIASSRRPHLTNTVVDDPQVSDRAWAKREGMVAFAGYPLVVEDRLLGVMAMFARQSLTEGILTELAPLAEGIAQFIDRRRAEERFRDQAELNRVTLASIGDAVLTTDAEGRVRFLNDVAVKLTGWSSHEAAGQPVDAVFPIINEVTGEPVENPVGKVLREGVIVGLANHTILIAKDGIRRPIDDSGSPIRDGEGHMVGAVLVFRDVTERRKAEEALLYSSERLTFALEAADLGQWELNLSDHTAARTSRHDQIFGYDAPLPEWTYERFLEHVLPDDRAAVDARFKETAATGSPLDVECRIRRADGMMRWIWTKARMHRDARGRVERMLGIVGDHTERKEAAEQLREASRNKDEFLATLAHELRNPLAPLRNGLQVMQLAKGNGEAVERSRAMMERQLAQMVRLIDDLLDVSRISRGKIDLRKERVDLAKIVYQAVETSRPLLEANGHELTIQPSPHALFVEADPTRLAQVFSNLLNNAAKYTERGGRVALTIREASAGGETPVAIVSVRDTGIGIPAPMLHRIFEMFTQVERAAERSQGGLGIGLSLVKGLVELHGGEVEARSDGPGKGAEFVVRLPLPREERRAASNDSEGAGLLAAGPLSLAPRRRILVVDDNRDNADSLAMMLRMLGNETRTAYDGEEAVAASAAFRPDVILLDIGLPKLNGHDACRRIREQPGGQQLVIIAQTGWGQAEDRQRTREAGFDHHLVKPVDPSALMKLLAELQGSKAPG